MLYFEDAIKSEWTKRPIACGNLPRQWGSAQYKHNKSSLLPTCIWRVRRLVPYSFILNPLSARDPRTLYERLNPVQGAAFDEGGARASKCMPGTRVDVIEKIKKWAKGETKALKEPICWVNAAAGYGKSAIARTIAEWCAEQGILGSSYFFLRGLGDRSKIASLVPTLAYHLSGFFPSTKPFIEEQLKEEHNILRQPTAYQFEKLLVDPFRRANIMFPQLKLPAAVIIIDALDECDDRVLMAGFVEAAIDAGKSWPFRILFTGRIDEHLRQIFQTEAAQSVTYSLSLHDFIADEDIRRFYIRTFMEIYARNRHIFMRGVPLPWPTNEDLNLLVNNTAGVFNYASTVVAFINDGSDLPHLQLQSVLKHHDGLDPVNTQIRSVAARNKDFDTVLGKLTPLADPLDVQVSETRKRVFGEKYLDTLASMANLALTYRNQGQWKEAEQLDVQVLETRKRDLGEEHPDTLTSMANLASTYGNQGRWKEAEQLEVQVSETTKRVLGEEHPFTLTSMANLASTYGNQGRWKEAEQLQVQVLETRKRVLGEEHPSTLRSMAILVSTYRNQGRWKEAKQLDNQVSETRKRVLDLNEATVRLDIPEQAPKPLSYPIDLAKVTDSPDIPERAPEPLSYSIDPTEVTDSPDVPEQAPELLSYSIDPAEVTDSLDVPEQVPEPLSYSIDLVRVTDSPDTPEQAPEPLSYSIDLVRITDSPDVEQAPEPLSYSIDLVGVTDSLDTPEQAPEPLSYSIDLAEVTDSPDIPEQAPEPQLFSVDLAEVTDSSDNSPFDVNNDSQDPHSFSIDLEENSDTEV